MPWYSFHYQDPRIRKLRDKYFVMGVPVMIVLDSKTGQLITKRGRKDVHEQGTKCLKDWAKLLKLNLERIHQELKEHELKLQEDEEIRRKFEEEQRRIAEDQARHRALAEAAEAA